MRYRRHETLRYTFEEPPQATFRIIKVAGKSVQSSNGYGKVIDISPGGLKLALDVHIPAVSEVQFFVQTTIGHMSLSITANGVWSKAVGNQYHYGMDFLEDYNEEVVKALKKYRKST